MGLHSFLCQVRMSDFSNLLFDLDCWYVGPPTIRVDRCLIVQNIIFIIKTWHRRPSLKLMTRTILLSLRLQYRTHIHRPLCVDRNFRMSIIHLHVQSWRKVRDGIFSRSFTLTKSANICLSLPSPHISPTPTHRLICPWHYCPYNPSSRQTSLQTGPGRPDIISLSAQATFPWNILPPAAVAWGDFFTACRPKRNV